MLIIKYILLFVSLYSVLACTNKKHNEYKNGNLDTITKTRQIPKQDIDVGDKFVGSWVFCNKSGRDDGSFNGVICTIERYRDTKKTFLVNISYCNQSYLVTTTKEENILASLNVAIVIVYIPSYGSYKRISY